MNSTLPPAATRKLEQTLSQWRNWQCAPPLQHPPQLVRTLGSGLSNYSALVEAERQFVVRIDGINPASHGLNRQTEWRTLRDASAAGLAPTPRYFNPELGTLVCDYLPPDERATSDPEAVGSLLREIHQLPARHHRLDLRAQIARYEKKVMQEDSDVVSELQRQRGPLHAVLETIDALDDPICLCHNDLLSANRIHSGGRLRALDWEYCAMASPWYDLAVVIEGDCMEQAQIDSLLQHYLQRDPVAAELSALWSYRCIYSYIETLWYLALDKPIHGDDVMLRRSAALAAKLSAFAPGTG